MANQISFDLNVARVVILERATEPATFSRPNVRLHLALSAMSGVLGIALIVVGAIVRALGRRASA